MSACHDRERACAEAAEQLGGLRELVRAGLNDAARLLDDEHADADAWLHLAERLRIACWMVGSATYCLGAWSGKGSPPQAGSLLAADRHGEPRATLGSRLRRLILGHPSNRDRERAPPETPETTPEPHH